MVKRWLRVFVVLIFFNILLEQVNESMESEMREKYSFTYFGAETESTENPKTTKTDYDVQVEKYQQINCNLLGDFMEEVGSRFIQSGVSQFFMKYNDWKKSFKPVVDESSSFPKEVVAAMEEALYQCDCNKPDTVEFFGEKKDYESLIELGLNDLCVDSEEIDVLFPKIATVSKYSDPDEKYDYLKEFYGIPDNCRNIFHVAGEKDNYIFVYNPDDRFSGQRFLVRLTERRGDEFTEISEFELTWEELNKSDCGVIQYGKEFYFVYFQYNKNEHEFDSIKAHRMNDDPKEDTMVIRYLPENYILDTVYSAGEDYIDDMHYWDKFIVEMGTKLFRGNYLKDGTGAVPEIYYGDGEKPVSDNVPGLGTNVCEADIANCDLPVYIRKKYGADCLEVSFYYYDSKRNLVKLSDLSVDGQSQSNVDLVQLWFQEIEGTTYAFRLYHVSEYNYLLNVLLVEEDRATIIRTMALSPTRKFVLKEGGTKEYEEPSLERLEKVLEEDEHYKISYIGNYNYYYAIYNSQGEIVDETETRRSPYIKYIDDTTIRIQVSMGTNARWTIYYDTLNDRFSEDCYNPLTEEYGKMVYLTWQEGESFLVVQDIFDKESYYEEISLDFSDVITPVESAMFLDENRLYVSYLSGESMENKDVVLELEK